MRFTRSSSGSRLPTVVAVLTLLSSCLLNDNGRVEADTSFPLRINKYYYLIKSSWGTPAQNLYLTLDLNSQDLWVYGGMCYSISTTCSQGTNNYYRKSNSTSYSAHSNTYSVDYSTLYEWSGSMSMEIAEDFFSINNHSLGKLSFGLVNQVDWSMYNKINTSGMLGLGLQSTTGMSSHLNSLLRSGGADSKANLTLYTNKNSSTGVLSVGRPDTIHCSSSWTYVPIISAKPPGRQYWEVPLSSFRFGNYSLSLKSLNTAIFSTTISYLAVPQMVFNQIKSRVAKLVYDYPHKHNIVNCYDRPKFPNISFTIGGRVFNVTSMEYIWQTPTNYCILKIVPSRSGSSWIFGYPFHQGHCEQYDFNSMTLGLTTRF